MRLQRWHDDETGSVAVEFAFLAPIIILIFVAVFELAMLEICRNDLELAAREASRFGITGTVPDGKTREQAIEDIVLRIAGNYFIPGSVEVTTGVYNDFSSTEPEPWTDLNGNGTYDKGESYVDVNKNGQYDFNMAASGAGGFNSIVRYTVTARRAYLTPIWRSLTGQSEAAFRVETLVKNEPG